MSKLTKEILISRGVKFVTEGNEIYFSVASLKKRVKGLKFKSSDISKKEINDKEVQVIKIQDITAGEIIEPENIEVNNPEILECKKACEGKEECDKKSCNNK